jgi:transposase
MPATTRLTTALPAPAGPAPTPPVLYLALELSERGWTLAFTTGRGQAPRIRKVAAGALDTLAAELERARRRFGLVPTAPVVSCYEAGRDGFWVHRALLARGVTNVVVDAASIEVNRRQRRAKTDRLDARKLVLMLVRWHEGERRVWHVVHVPSDADEDRRHLDRERQTLVGEHTRLVNRLQELLATQGVTLALRGDVRAQLATVRRWDGTPLPPGLQARLEREWGRIDAVRTALRTLERERHQRLTAPTPAAGDAPVIAKARRLLQLRAIGETLAWVFATELFGWRAFQNRRQVGGFVGLTPTPFQSGGGPREQGITRNGSRELRALVIELAWLWLRYQPQSALSQWYQRAYRGKSSRLRRIGIVALGRKLLIALWRYVDFGELPVGARLKDTAASTEAIAA